MIKFILKKNTMSSSTAFGRYYAWPVIDETMNLRALAKHMSEHNSGFSEAMCLGVITAMIRCIKEMILQGKNVKIDDLAIFSCGIRNASGGAKSEEDFNVNRNIRGVKLRARATGMLSNVSLNLDATLRKASAVTGSTPTATTPETGV
ncbi:DNA-binding protein [Prevotella sp. PCHR]|uniref:DNA-binding protein n=1 Tax=Xylanibacter caecicola TaxID=2736294 RepID=A0ABX2B3T9_9BACT|nr:DNA-binding protein [Xylanibacter caecicola]NPE25072.1 DNA-binding protein [Xylanibacter caecicola]